MTLMTNDTRLVTGLPDHHPLPEIRKIGWADISQALELAAADFRAAPRLGLIFGAVYALLGGFGLLGLAGLGWTHLIFPAFSGFLLVGPIAALGLYEISRRRETGQPLRDTGIFLAFRRPNIAQIGLLGLLLVMATNLWFVCAAVLYAIAFPSGHDSLWGLITDALTTPGGLLFTLVGSGIGGILATGIFTCCAFTAPMLLDRDVDIVTAMLTSVEAVKANKLMAFCWAAIIAGLIAGGMALGMIGLVIALPLIGHASWHLYRRVIAPA